MTWQAAARASGSSPSGLFDGGFNWGLVLLWTVGLAALGIVCSLGFIARMRDRAADRQAQEVRDLASASQDGATDA